MEGIYWGGQNEEEEEEGGGGEEEEEIIMLVNLYQSTWHDITSQKKVLSNISSLRNPYIFTSCNQ
jgi:hypothetical protein